MDASSSHESHQAFLQRINAQSAVQALSCQQAYSDWLSNHPAPSKQKTTSQMTLARALVRQRKCFPSLPSPTNVIDDEINVTGAERIQ